MPAIDEMQLENVRITGFMCSDPARNAATAKLATKPSLLCRCPQTLGRGTASRNSLRISFFAVRLPRISPRSTEVTGTNRKEDRVRIRIRNPFLPAFVSSVSSVVRNRAGRRQVPRESWLAPRRPSTETLSVRSAPQ